MPITNVACNYSTGAWSFDSIPFLTLTTGIEPGSSDCESIHCAKTKRECRHCKKRAPPPYQRCCQRNGRWLLTTGNDGRSCFEQLSVDNTSDVDNSYCGLTPCRAEGRINIWTYFYLKAEYLPRRTSAGGSECGNRISDADFLLVYSTQ